MGNVSGRSGRRLSVAVAYSGMNSEYQDKICRGILDKARQENYNLAFFAPLSETGNHSLHDSGEEKIFDLINFDRFDAFVILPNSIADQETVDRLISRALGSSVPVISVDRNMAGCSSVQIDYCGGFDELMDHLIVGHGYTRINYVGAYEYDFEADKRFVIYRNALRKHGIPYDKNRVCFAEFDEYKAVMMVREYLNSGNGMPQAFVCANDSMAVSVCDELVRLGYSVPKDVAVTGFDGIRYAEGHFPSLTTVEVAYYSAGCSAIEIVAEAVRLSRLNKKEYIRVQVRNSFSAGESCGCMKSGEDHVVHNELLHRLNSENDRFRSFSNRLISMSEELTRVNSFDSAFRKLVYYIEDIYVDRFYLCLNTHFDQEDSKTKNFSEYSDTIDCRISRERKEYGPRFTFEKSQILPALFTDSVLPNVFFITPLHFHDRNYGYIALSCDGYIGSNALFNTWKMNVSTALENIRVRSMLTEYSNTLERMYVRDPLTNLLNRRGLLTRAAELFESAKSRGKKVFVLAADLDDLKIINDRYGHYEGDNALIQVGNTLNRVARHRELCARFGGDEFEVMAFNYSDEFAKTYVDAVERMLNGYNDVSEKPYKVRASCGYIVETPGKDDTLEDFIKRADALMYENKRCRKQQSDKSDKQTK